MSADALRLLPVLFDTGDNIIVTTVKSNGALTNNACSGIEEASNLVQQTLAIGDTAFIKHATFDGATSVGKYGKIMPDCHAEHVVGSRTFALDIDGSHHTRGTPAPYPSVEAALDAFNLTLVKLAEMGCPQPTMVGLTGGGVLVTWVVTERMPVKEWKTYEHALSQLAIKHHLFVDTGMDPPDRGLRVIGEDAYNRKDPMRIRETKIVSFNPTRIPVATWKGWLEPHVGLKVVSPHVTRAKIDFPPNAEYMVDTTTPIDVLAVVPDCVILRDAVATQGREHNYHEWHHVIAQIARHHDEAAGNSLAHAVSSGHEKYDGGVKVDEKLAEQRKSRHPGWITCLTMSKVSPGFKAKCDACEFGELVAAGRSPQYIGNLKAIKLASATPSSVVAFSSFRGGGKTEPASPATPPPAGIHIMEGLAYVNTPNGIYLATPVDDEKDAVVWPNYNMSNVVVSNGFNGMHSTMRFTLTTVPERGNAKDVLWAINDIHDPKALASLSAKLSGVNVEPVYSRKIFTMMTAFTTAMLDRKQSRQAYSGMGWAEDKSFVLGDAVVSATGTRPLLMTDATNGLGTHGDEAIYNAVMNEVMAGETRPEAHAMVAAAFVGPLFHLTGSDGVLLNFYSGRSGFGKSTLVKLGAAAWGARSSLVANADDTPNALFQRLTVLRNLPLYLDELRAVDQSKYILAILFRLIAGMEKRRLDSNAQAKEAGEWKTIMISATNFSIAGVIDTGKNAGDAASSRFLDFNLPPLPPDSINRANALMKRLTLLDSNYGFAGRKFMEAVIPQYDAISDNVLAYTKKLMPHTATSSSDTSGRFQCAAGACLLVASNILERTGIAPVSTKLVLDAVIAALRVGKDDRKSAQEKVGYEDILREFFKAKEGSRLMLRRSAERGLMMRSDHPFVTRPIAYEVLITDKEVVIDWREMHKFLLERGHNSSEVFREIEKDYPHAMRPMGVGTAYATTIRKVIPIALPGTAWAGLADS